MLLLFFKFLDASWPADTRLVVKLIEAKNLLASDVETGKSDPLAFVWCCSNEVGHKTCSLVCTGGLHNKTYSINVASNVTATAPQFFLGSDVQLLILFNRF